MVANLRDRIEELLNAHLNRVLSAAELGIQKKRRYAVFRTIALNEFGKQGFLTELDALLKQQGQARIGLAHTAGKEVPK